MAYQSVNPANGEILRRFDQHTDEQMQSALATFIIYAQSHSGVAFMRKDEIARFALESSLTVREGI